MFRSNSLRDFLLLFQQHRRCINCGIGSNFHNIQPTSQIRQITFTWRSSTRTGQATDPGNIVNFDISHDFCFTINIKSPIYHSNNMTSLIYIGNRSRQRNRVPISRNIFIANLAKTGYHKIRYLISFHIKYFTYFNFSTKLIRYICKNRNIGCFCKKYKTTVKQPDIL